MHVQRYSGNPILTREDIPELRPQIVDATSVFNPGAIKFGDVYLLMLRVQTRGRETYLMMAESNNGVDFLVRKDIVHFRGIESWEGTLYHIYDPRISRVEDDYYVMFAADTEDGCRLGVARTNDFDVFELVGIAAERDVRNGVLFPERSGGKYLRFDRPNEASKDGDSTSGDAIYLSESDDLLEWRRLGCVLRGRPHYWDEKIGSGPPPVRTREGWLHVYHGIATHFASVNIYQVGVALHDLGNPLAVISRSRNNILEPRELYELVGQVPNVVFPTGLIVDEYDAEGFARPDSRVLIYYGAADTCVAVAVTTTADLVNASRD